MVDNLNVNSSEYEIVLITPHKLTDKVYIKYLDLLYSDKFKFESALIINQTLLSLYAYNNNSNVGIICSLGEKIDITPICNGVPFQSGVTNLSYGATVMSEFLNSFISRGHVK